MTFLQHPGFRPITTGHNRQGCYISASLPIFTPTSLLRRMGNLETLGDFDLRLKSLLSNLDLNYLWIPAETASVGQSFSF